MKIESYLEENWKRLLFVWFGNVLVIHEIKLLFSYGNELSYTCKRCWHSKADAVLSVHF